MNHDIATTSDKKQETWTYKKHRIGSYTRHSNINIETHTTHDTRHDPARVY